MSTRPAAGTIGWVDLTVPEAAAVRDFYRDVVGWTSSEVPMGDYADYCVHPPGAPADAPPAGGICHARGENADLPPSWIIYIHVDDLDTSLARCVERGGSIVRPARDLGGHGRMAVIRDPAGAVAALFQAPAG